MSQGDRKARQSCSASDKEVQPDRQRRRVLGAGLAGTALGSAALLSAPAVRAEKARVWRLVTSWPRNAPGPGTTAERIAEKITQLSNGRLTVKLYGGGELVPPLGVFDAVSAGTAEMAHTASLFWSGKATVAPIFTAAPFGLLPESHNAWIDFGGGQALWDELYGQFGIKPLLAGNSGFQMGGWYKKEITGLDSFKGLKVRMPGLGGEILRQLGGVPVTLPPGGIFQALQTGMIDGAEFLGPWSDRSLGLDRVASYYYWPGFHEPNGSAEALINRQAFEDLPADLRELIVTVCAAENQRGMAEAEWYNAQALKGFVEEGKVKLRPFPDEVLEEARVISEDVMLNLAGQDDLSGRIIDSYLEAKQSAVAWGQITRQALLQQQGEAD
ncbi:TRAP transporter substrate-binding protein [Rhodovibrionaceae bacterium A322]